MLPVALMSTDTICIQSNQFFIDPDLKLVLSNLDIEAINSSSEGIKTHLLLDEVWELDTPIEQVEVGVDYQIRLPHQDSSFSLYFTELPTIRITTGLSIIDEEDIPAYFTLIKSDGSTIESHIGVQYRGGWTQTLPKKSMEIEFWKNELGNEHKDYSLLGMRKDDDWNLQAMANEPLRIRSKTNFDLWRKINTLHYQENEPQAINGIHMEYVELFVNSEYQGLYCLGEKLDRKQLKLKHHDGNINGELYKGVSWGVPTFGALPPYDNTSIEWGGFEYKHPNEEVDWSHLYEFIDFVKNSDDDTFYEEFANKFNIDNLVDYYIFLNLLRATDNTGKNIYIAKYEADDTYFYAPWDLDGTFGTIWMGTDDPTTTGLLTNRFFDRLFNEPCLEGGFREQLKDKWTKLRLSPLSEQALIAMFTDNYNHLQRNGVYEREELAWTDYVYQSNDLAYLSEWTGERLTYLDLIFGKDCEPILSTNNLSSTDQFKVYLESQQDQLTITSDFHDDIDVSIYHSTGQRVYSTTTSSSSTISIPHLTNGLYFVTLSLDGRMETHKIVVP